MSAGRRVGLLAVGPASEAAWAVLSQLEGAGGRRVSLNDLPLGELDVLWVHATAEPPPLAREPLGAWIAAGGRLLLTQRATGLVASLGLEDHGPNDVLVRAWTHEDDELWFPEFRSFGGFPHIRGIAAYGPHPLLAGLGQGTYLWAPTEGERYSRATYERGKRPGRGRVVACERSYIHLNADRIVAWEYDVGAGGALCIGAFVAPEAQDRMLERQLRAVLSNALLGDGIPGARRTGPAAHWPAPGTTGRADEHLAMPEGLSLDGAFPSLDSPLAVDSRALTDEAFSLAGRRVLVVGGEQSGVREIWTHPYRALKNFTVSVGGETPLVRDVRIAPTVVQRHLVTGQRIVTEVITTALEQPLALLEYRSERVGRARNVHAAPGLLLQWMIDLRRVWPYDVGCGGDLRYRVDAGGAGLLVTDSAEDGRGGGHVLVQANQPVEWTVKPAEGGPAVHCTIAVALEEPLRIAVLGGAGRDDLDAAGRAVARRGVSGVTGQRRRHETQVREYLTRLASPDERLNVAFEWAKVRLDACFVDTPGVGRALVGGYAASRSGWGDGRPGYAWYFGRDACWSALALLAAGDFSGARLALRFLGDTQDATGKVIHEYTTSGLAHYDAADSTPLYLLLAGRYAAWTGDLPFLEAQWPRLEAAYRFCLETDSDGDGLIENTRVGHGWIEMGPLSGSHVSLYLAAIWIAALEALAPAARALGKGALAAELEQRASRARAAAATRFRTATGYALGVLPDGTPQAHETALTSVALLLGAVDPAPAAPWLDAVAADGFSTPWGVRLVPKEDPLYNPTGYHAGAVWPLYTGWTSLAEYACGRAEAAYRHLAANARLPFARSLGAFDEVLHGHVEMAAGLCPDQCWSAAMVISPVIEGLLGARPDALRGRLTLAPQLPAEWRDCEWRDVHVGRTSLDVRVTRQADRLVVRLRRTSGRRLRVTIEPRRGAPAADSVSVDVSAEHTVEIPERPT